MTKLLGDQTIEGDSLNIDVVPFNLKISLKQPGPLYFDVVRDLDFKTIDFAQWELYSNKVEEQLTILRS